MKKTIHNILVPVDFTEYSLNSIEIAAQIAQQNNGLITLLHIIDLGVSKYVGIDVDGGLTLDSVIERYLNLLNRIKSDISNRYRIDVHILLEKGSVVSYILAKTREMNSDLIVIGTHGTEPRNFFLGENAFHIIKQSYCSVITIPKERINGAVSKIIFPGKTIHDMDEKCAFLESVVHEQDLAIEISGLNNGAGFNISVLNETIEFLEKKFIQENVKSIGELKNFIDIISDSLQDLNIELITINSKKSPAQVPVLSIVNT